MDNALGFIDPTAGGGVAPLPLARRRMDLAGATVGLLDNTKEQGDVILQTLGERIGRHQKPVPIHASDPDMVNRPIRAL